MAKFVALTDASNGDPVYVNAEHILFLQVRQQKKSPDMTMLHFSDGKKLHISASPQDVIAAIGKAERGHP